MAFNLDPNRRKQVLLGGIVLLLGISYWQRDTSSGLPATPSRIHVPLTGQHPVPSPATHPAQPNDNETKEFVKAFVVTLFSHDGKTYAAQLAKVQPWADTSALNVVRREFALEGMLDYYAKQDAGQVSQLDSIQLVPEAAGRYLARIFSRNQVMQAGRSVHSYPLVAILTLKTVPVTVANPYGRHVTSFQFTHPANQPILDSRFK